jgi:hypothetical protein
VIQRFGSSLALNVHFHTLAVDGAWARQADGNLLFHPLPAPNDEDVARIARAVCRKVGRLLARVKTTDDGQTSLLDDLANASVQGLVAKGPRRRRLSHGDAGVVGARASRKCRLFGLGASSVADKIRSWGATAHRAPLPQSPRCRPCTRSTWPPITAVG